MLHHLQSPLLHATLFSPPPTSTRKYLFPCTLTPVLKSQCYLDRPKVLNITMQLHLLIPLLHLESPSQCHLPYNIL